MSLLPNEMKSPLTSKELELMNAYWRACNYLSVGMIYLRGDPLLLGEPCEDRARQSTACSATGARARRFPSRGYT